MNSIDFWKAVGRYERQGYTSQKAFAMAEADRKHLESNREGE